MRIGSLFSGAGGLDLAVANIFGGEVVWHSEIDKAASKVLAHHWPDVPNLGDVTQIDFRDVEKVDVLCGGFPCQDVSAAGKRAGIKAGTRSGLWALFANAIDVVRPRLVVIENVRGLLSARAHRNLEPADGAVGDGSDGPVLRAAGAVLGDLADLGYDAIWATVAAADVGAPHRRERVFIVATDTERRGGTRVEDAAGDSETDSQRRQAILARGLGHPGGKRPDGLELLPTPCVVDRLATGEMTLEEWDESRRSQKERGVGSFGPRGDSLGAAILRVEEGSERPDYSTTKARRGGDEPGVALLPTPTAVQGRNETSGRSNPESKHHSGTPLHDLVFKGELLSTPQSRDHKGRPSDGFNQANLCRDVAKVAEWDKYEPAIRRWEALTRPAPAPTEPNKNGNPRLSAAFSEWLMGWPDGWVTDPDIGISRNDQLRIIGNGVCPQQAIHAINYLLTIWGKAAA